MEEKLKISKTRPVIMFMSDSFNPPTLMQLRAFDLVKDHFQDKGLIVLGGIVSPTHDSALKEDPIFSNHRLEMVRQSLIDNDDVAKLSSWEIEQEQWSSPRLVLDTHQALVRSFCQGSGEKQPWMPEKLKPVEDPADIPRLVLICGTEVIESVIQEPGLWHEEDIEAIGRDHRLAVITYQGSNPEEWIHPDTVLYNIKNKIEIVRELPGVRAVSCAAVRSDIRDGRSVKFVLPDRVIDYINKNHLFPKEK